MVGNTLHNEKSNRSNCTSFWWILLSNPLPKNSIKKLPKKTRTKTQLAKLCHQQQCHQVVSKPAAIQTFATHAVEIRALSQQFLSTGRPQSARELRQAIFFASSAWVAAPLCKDYRKWRATRACSTSSLCNLMSSLDGG